MMDQAIHNKIVSLHPWLRSQPRAAFAFDTGQSDAFSRR